MRSRISSLVLILALGASPAFSQPSDSYFKTNKQILNALVDVVAKPAESTVRVRCGDKDAALGTVVGTDGWILTKFSELKGDAICKLHDGREFQAKLFSVEPEFDLALLKIDAKNLPVAEWRESKEDGVGSWVASPSMEKTPAAIGVISVMTRKINVQGAPRYTPGPNSGYLGVIMEDSKDGVLIREVSSGTPAAKAGLKQGDVIKFIDGRPTTNRETMAEILGRHRKGDKVTIKFERDGKPMEVTPELAQRPPDRGLQQNTMGSKLSDRRTGFPVILQHDTVIAPTDCGGPLVDLDGRVVGVNIARAGRTESYAIPAETVQKLVVDMEAGKYPPPKPDLMAVFGPQIQEAEDKVRDLKGEKSSLEKRIKDAEEARRKQEQKIKDDTEQLRKQEQKIKDAEAALRKLQEKLEAAKKADDKKSDDKKVDKKSDDKKQDDKKQDDKKPE